MTHTISFDLLEEIAQEVGGSVRTDYSGRGMFGNTCVGIVVDGEFGLVRLGATIAELVEDIELKRALLATSTDSMGYDTIAYWTQVTCSDAPDEYED